MLKTKSFAITDSEGINELLSNFIIPKDSQILVSEGHVLIPYEDGEPVSKKQKALRLTEEKNTFLYQISIIEHSIAVVEDQRIAFEEQVNTLRADVAEIKSLPKPSGEDAKATYDKRQAEKKEKEEQIAHLENSIKDSRRQVTMNSYEKQRLEINVRHFDNMIDQLTA